MKSTSDNIYSFYASHYNSLFESVDDMNDDVNINDSANLYTQEYIYLFVHAIASTHNIKFKFMDPEGEDTEVSQMDIMCDNPGDASKLSKLLNDEYKKLMSLGADEEEYMDNIQSIFSSNVKGIEADDKIVRIYAK